MIMRVGFDRAVASFARAIVREGGETLGDATATTRDRLAYEIACHEVDCARQARRAGQAAPADAMEV